MHVITAKGPSAEVTISHARAYDFDEKRGVWLFRKVDEDETVRNIVTNAGRVQLHTFMYGTSSRASGFRFIGLSNDGAATAASDTTLASELVGNGLSRVAAGVTLPVGAGTQTIISNIFAFSGGSPQAVQKSALFDTASGGVMAHEILFAQRTLQPGDNLTVSYTITLA